MDKQLQKKLVVGQATIWAGTMVVNAIVLVILDNWDGRFKFPMVSMFSLQSIIFCFIVAQAHLQSILKRANAAVAGSEQQPTGDEPASES